MIENQTDHETTATVPSPPNPATGEVALTLAVVFESPDRDTPVFNETVNDLREQLPSLVAHASPATPVEASNQTADDSGDGDQD